MKIKGNFMLLYAVQAITGILVWFASQKWGLPGLIIGLIPFFIVMFIVLMWHKMDEREMQLSHKINSYDSICFGIIAAIIYLFFPGLNWFFALIAASSLARGTIGILFFVLR